MRRTSLRKIRVDEKLTHGSGGESSPGSPRIKPSQLVGLAVQYVLMVFVVGPTTATYRAGPEGTEAFRVR